MASRIKKCMTLGLFFVLTPSIVFAAGVGKFTALEGRVDVRRPGEAQARPLIEGDVVASGDVIRTKSLSKAEIRFNDNTVMRLAESTRVEITEYSLDNFDFRKNAVINLQRGKIRVIVEEEKTVDSENFIVNTPNASSRVKGSDGFFFYHKSATGILVNSGTFSVMNTDFPEQELDVTKGLMTVVSPNQPPQQPRQYLDFEGKQHEAQTTITRAPVADDPTQIRAIVVKISGEVRVKRVSRNKWSVLQQDDILGTGDRIETKESGKVELRLDNGNIINLKPNSTIILESLRRNTETGEYENLFQANLGNIRAKVQKLKGDSKFEIRTPTAVCSVRGTTLYMVILPGLTTVYFEHGDGALTSLVSQVSRVVQDGNTASADDKGNVSDPIETSDDQKSDWSSGWESGEDIGYSPADSGAGDAFFEGETGDEGGTGEDGGTTDTGDTTGDTTVDVPPVPDSGGRDGGDTDTGPSDVTDLTGAVEGGFVEGAGEPGATLTGAIVASLSASTSTPTWSGSSTATVQGSITNPPPPDERSSWVADLGGTADDGGAFSGILTGSWHSWDGALSAIYIDPSQTAGTILGYVGGTTDDAAGTFTGAGDVFFVPMGQTEVLPGQLVDPGSGVLGEWWGEGAFGMELSSDAGTGRIGGYFDRYGQFMEDSWGIWSSVYNGGYDRPEGASQWSGTGSGFFYEDSPGYFATVAQGRDDLNGALRMDVISSYLDTEHIRHSPRNLYRGRSRVCPIFF
ncbi:MAG: FecR domain-containing protein [Candidatus Omnitrophica bacterium]|nr:FecR domain-containing protein [Candidatus Omnitrophota bacterium]